MNALEVSYIGMLGSAVAAVNANPYSMTLCVL